MLELRKAIPEDVKEFYGKNSVFSFKGYTGVQDGKVVGVVGIYYIQGVAVVFSEIKEGISKKLVVMGIRKIVEDMNDLTYPVYAVTRESEKLLIRVGFKPTGVSGPCGKVYIREV